MKSIINKYFLIQLLIVGLVLSFGACSEEGHDYNRENNPTIEKIGVPLSELINLRDNSSYGDEKGQYPPESKDILKDIIPELGRLIISIDKGESISDSQIDAAIKKGEKAIADFKETIRLTTNLYDAELYVNGNKGGYIDFGKSADFINFGTVKNRSFTVELWLKIKSRPDGIGAFLSTFIENGGNRAGWMVNMINGDFVRMTYALKREHGLWEPGTGYFGINEWIHIAFVYDDKGVDGETEGGRPVVVKYYLNGELKTKVIEDTSADGNQYGGNDNGLPELSMLGFAQHHPDGARTRSSEGYMKYMRIWKSDKSANEVINLMDGTTKVTGKETDLICAWDFTQRAEDSQNIKDLTGKHTAALKGEFSWIKLTE